jgi:hypothetical protein
MRSERWHERTPTTRTRNCSSGVTRWNRAAWTIAVLATFTAGAVSAATKTKAAAPPAKSAPAAPAPAAARPGEAGSDETPVPGESTHAKKDMTLPGDAPGTVFKTLTIEGEDRIHLEIERPALALDLDPSTAPGLDLGSARDVMDRTRPDLQAALFGAVAAEPSPCTARPWLDGFASGPVARFRPDVTDVDTWALTVTDARGRTAARFEGHGRPPKEIAWDGKSPNGDGALPGITYSFVLEARDKAGNKRHFVGDGFEVPAYATQTEDRLALAFAADVGDGGATPERLAEAASRVNQMPAASPVQIVVIARTHARGDAIARTVHEGLRTMLVGDPARVREHVVVEADAPERSAVRIVVGK